MRKIASKPCGECGLPVPRRVTPNGSGYWRKLCGVCGSTSGKGDRHPQWTGGRSVIGKSGYVRVNVVPGQERQLEHRVIWERAHGPIPKGSHVHHLNRDKTDNRLENLTIVTNREHQAIHRGDRGLGERWSLQYECCQSCGTRERPHCVRGFCRPCHETNLRRARGVRTLASVRGEQHPRAKLTEDRVRHIRQQVAGGQSGRSVAREYEVSQTTVRRVVDRTYWPHVE